MKRGNTCTRIIALALLLPRSLQAAEAQSQLSPSEGPRPAFQATASGEFTFDTGVLRGTLRPGGKSLGLVGVTHVPSGKRLDRSNGLLSHYRVFTKGVRYGDGAWDWPGAAKLRSDGAVEVHWPSIAQRPFEMHAVYRWRASDTLDLDTTVEARKDLNGFESFVASYLTESFTNAAVFAAQPPGNNGSPGFVRLAREAGAWQMFPRDRTMVPLIEDGRWRLQPNPVTWTIRPPFARALALRRDPESGLTVAFMSSASDCFALASPEEQEVHFSMYLSLFGRDIKAGQTLVARSRLVVLVGASDDEVLRLYDRSFK